MTNEEKLREIFPKTIFIYRKKDDKTTAIMCSDEWLNAEYKGPTIKALGEELRKARKGIADEKVLIGYNLAVAICNKHLGESEGV